MKRFGYTMAAAVLSMGIAGMAPISSQAGLQTIIIGGNSQSCGNNNSFSGNCLYDFNSLFGGNNLSCIPYYCPSSYPANSNCSNNNYYFNSEEYFPGQRPGQNYPSQNQPNTTKPEQNRPAENNPSQSTPDKDNSDQTTSEENTNRTYVQQVIDLVNEERSKAGLSPLKESSAVSNAAYIRSKEITQNFSHTRPNGTYFSTVLSQNGISFSSSGENIAYGQRTPKEVMNTWMNSSGHRANILNSNYTTIGVGCYQASNGTIYWTQLFTR